MEPTGADNRWEGSIEWIPQEEGLPFLKIIATDGEGENAYVDIITRTLTVEDGDTSSFGSLLIGIGTGLILTFLAVLFIVRRRAKLADIDSMISWEAFRNPGEQKDVPELDSSQDETDEEAIMPAMVDLDDL